MNKKLFLSLVLITTLSAWGSGEKEKVSDLIDKDAQAEKAAYHALHQNRWVENEGIWRQDSTGKLTFTPLKKSVGVNGEWADDGTWISYW